MRLSDLISKKPNMVPSPPLPPAVVPAETAPPPDTLPDTPTIEPVPQEEQQTPLASSPSQPPATTENTTVYNSLPSALYQAAEQLEIPIPQNAKLSINNAVESMTNVFAAAIDPVSDKTDLWQTVHKTAHELATVIALDANLTRVSDVVENEHNRLPVHCVNVALTAIRLTRDVKKKEFSASEIGAAALLHDIGHLALGTPLPDLLTDEGRPEHVEQSVAIAQFLAAPASVTTMIAQHHERIDGSGFPKGITNAQLLNSSQILALADGFELIMTEVLLPPSGKNQMNENYVQETLNRFHKTLSPDILKTFISMRGFYPDGMMVELTNRSICLVIKQNEGFPLRPVVQVVIDSAGSHPDSARIVDLRSTSTLSIVRSVTQNR